MNASEKKGDQWKVRRKRKSREEAGEDEILAKRIMSEGGDQKSYRPVRQRTVRSDTTKDRAGGLPPAGYAVQPTANGSEERLRFPEEIDIIRSNSVPQPVVSIQFVDCGNVSEMFEDHREVQIDEYETDSDDEDTENKGHLELVKRACITRSGRAVRAFVRLDL